MAVEIGIYRCVYKCTNRRGGFQPSLNVAFMELYIQKNTFGFVQKYQHLQNLQGLGRVKTLPYGNVVTTLQTEICTFLFVKKIRDYKM